MFELFIQIEDEDLKKMYQEKINILHKTYCYNSSDSGFDLFIPKDVIINPKETKLINLQIKCQPKFPGGYYLYPRSSFGKTSLRLKNSVGVIDHGYRNFLGALVENTSDTEVVELKKGERYFQLCHPSLIAMQVKLTDKLNDTSRGLGGFGSTGK
jgi:dUTP pyrophosphatase